MKISRVSVWVAAAGFAVAATGTSHAALLIDNAGFEQPEVTSSNGVTTDFTITDWTPGLGTIQILENGGSAGLNSQGLTAPEGDQAVRLIESGSNGENVILRQELGTIEQSEIDNLSLQFDLGRDENNELPVTTVGMVFFDSGDNLVGASFVNGLEAPASGTFETRTFSLANFVSDAGASAGDTVQLRLIAREGNFDGLAAGLAGVSGTDGSDSRERVYFDNFTLVPEPTTAGMVAVGLAGLLLRRRRN